MKIKVVDMPYEQALAQPREKHTPPRRPSMLFRAACVSLYRTPERQRASPRCPRLTCARRIFAVTAWAWSGSAPTSPVSF